VARISAGEANLLKTQDTFTPMVAATQSQDTLFFRKELARDLRVKHGQLEADMGTAHGTIRRAPSFASLVLGG